MEWKVTSRAVLAMHHLLLQMKAMPGCRAMFLGITEETKTIRQMLEIELGLGDVDPGDFHGIAQKLNASLSKGAPQEPRIAEKLQEWEMMRGAYELLVHMGVHPARLIIACGAAASISAWRGNETASLTSIVTSRTDCRITAKVALGTNVSWNGSQLTMRKTLLPQSMAVSLPGRRMSEVIGHDWPGWNQIVITGVGQKGDSTIIRTNANDFFRLLPAHA